MLPMLLCTHLSRIIACHVPLPWGLTQYLLSLLVFLFVFLLLANNGVIAAHIRNFTTQMTGSEGHVMVMLLWKGLLMSLPQSGE